MKIFTFIREKWAKILLLALVIGILIFLFLPRKLANLCNFERENVERVTVHRFQMEQEGPDRARYPLDSEEKLVEFYELMESTYVRPAIFRKNYVNGGEYYGYYLEIVLKEPRKDVPPLGGLFTREIISVDGVQYYLYGDDFSDFFENLR